MWAHDTAIAVAGLARDGHEAVAGALAESLVTAGAAFGNRLPELYSGDARDAVPRPVPYPASCRPQAWSAAAAVSLLTAVLGCDQTSPPARCRWRRSRSAPFGALGVAGLRVGAHDLAIEVDALRTGACDHGRAGAHPHLSGSGILARTAR